MSTTPAKRDYDREMRAQYQRLGLCPCCHGQEAAPPGGVVGLACREERRQYFARRREQLRAQRRCGDCGAPLDRAGPTCMRCREKASQASLRYAHRTRAEGQCAQCTQPAQPGRTRCQRCALAGNAGQRERYRERRALEPTCVHQWYDTLRIHDAFVAGRVYVVWMEKCTICLKRVQHRLWASPERLLELVALLRLGEWK